MANFVAFISGLLFALGLGISGMTDPRKVQSFLDVTGNWDPSLAFVMVGAIPVVMVAHRVLLRRRTTWLGQAPSLPTKTTIDRPLVIGSMLFGMGWGLGGYCPAPAITSLPTAGLPVLVFTAAMVTGMALFHAVQRRRAQSAIAAVAIPRPPRIPSSLVDGEV